MSWSFYMSLFIIMFIFFILFLLKDLLFQFLQRNALGIHPDSTDDISITRDQISISPNIDEFRIYESDTCPICLENFQYKIETNCGHEFCGNCFTLYWHVGNFVRNVHCPMCRTNVNLIVKSFSSEEVNCSNDNKKRIVDEINCFNRLYSNAPRSWTEQILDVPVILRHGIRHLFDGNSISIIHRLRIAVLSVIVIGYCLSPLDIIPESGFGILGFLDDILILATFLMYMIVFFRRAVGGNV